MKRNRQEKIIDLINKHNVETQEQLASLLKGAGYDVTQATVSRDIGDMGLCKLSDGVYVLAEDLHLQRMVSEFVSSVEAAENLVIVKTQPGTASGVAAAVDAANLPEIKGSVAGNDTVLVVSANARDAALVVSLIEKLRASRR